MNVSTSTSSEQLIVEARGFPSSACRQSACTHDEGGNQHALSRRSPAGAIERGTQKVISRPSSGHQQAMIGHAWKRTSVPKRTYSQPAPRGHTTARRSRPLRFSWRMRVGRGERRCEHLHAAVASRGGPRSPGGCVGQGAAVSQCHLQDQLLPAAPRACLR